MAPRSSSRSQKPLTGLRPRRVSKQIYQVLTQVLISREVPMPELEDALRRALISIVHVQVPPDLKTARVFVTLMVEDAATKASILATLNRYAYQFQRCLGRELTMKFTPVVTFCEDTFQATVDRTEALFHKIQSAPAVQDAPEHEDKDEDHA